MDAIAEQEGVDRKTVYNVARRAGLPHRHRFDPSRTARILAAYRTGERLREIAARESVCSSYVGAVARRAGLLPREGWQRRYPLNESAFDAPDSVGWWLVGLLAADGSIARKSNQISLTQSERDADVLHNFLAYVGSPDKPLIELKLSPAASARAHPRTRAFVAYVNSSHMKASLAEYGVIPGKTKRLKLSKEAADEPAVWLGLLDGDGWVSTTGQRGRPVLDFCGTPAVMKQCSDFWGARLAFQRVSAPSVQAHRAGLMRVRLHGANAARASAILLAASQISLARKRRTLEAIVAAEAIGAAAQPV